MNFEYLQIKIVSYKLGIRQRSVCLYFLIHLQDRFLVFEVAASMVPVICMTSALFEGEKKKREIELLLAGVAVLLGRVRQLLRMTEAGWQHWQHPLPPWSFCHSLLLKGRVVWSCVFHITCRVPSRQAVLHVVYRPVLLSVLIHGPFWKILPQCWVFQGSLWLFKGKRDMLCLFPEKQLL